jgi:hypothetical protein
MSASSSSVGEWGIFQPGESIASVTQLHPGDLILERTRKPGFTAPRHHVVEIIGGDPTGGSRALVRGRLVEPSDPTRKLPDTPGWIVLWDFYLKDGLTEIFRAVRS